VPHELCLIYSRASRIVPDLELDRGYMFEYVLRMLACVCARTALYQGSMRRLSACVACLYVCLHSLPRTRAPLLSAVHARAGEGENLKILLHPHHPKSPSPPYVTLTSAPSLPCGWGHQAV
jgi:hypothetical protein